MSVIRSEITTDGIVKLLLGVSNQENLAPDGLIIYRDINSGDRTHVTVQKHDGYNVPCLRNIFAGTYELTSGSSSMENGYIYLQLQE